MGYLKSCYILQFIIAPVIFQISVANETNLTTLICPVFKRLYNILHKNKEGTLNKTSASTNMLSGETTYLHQYSSYEVSQIKVKKEVRTYRMTQTKIFEVANEKVSANPKTDPRETMVPDMKLAADNPSLIPTHGENASTDRYSTPVIPTTTPAYNQGAPNEGYIYNTQSQDIPPVIPAHGENAPTEAYRYNAPTEAHRYNTPVIPNEIPSHSQSTPIEGYKHSTHVTSTDNQAHSKSTTTEGYRYNTVGTSGQKTNPSGATALGDTFIVDNQPAIQPHNQNTSAEMYPAVIPAHGQSIPGERYPAVIPPRSQNTPTDGYAPVKPAHSQTAPNEGDPSVIPAHGNTPTEGFRHSTQDIPTDIQARNRRTPINTQTGSRNTPNDTQTHRRNNPPLIPAHTEVNPTESYGYNNQPISSREYEQSIPMQRLVQQITSQINQNHNQLGQQLNQKINLVQKEIEKQNDSIKKINDQRIELNNENKNLRHKLALDNQRMIPEHLAQQITSQIGQNNHQLDQQLNRKINSVQNEIRKQNDNIKSTNARVPLNNKNQHRRRRNDNSEKRNAADSELKNVKRIVKTYQDDILRLDQQFKNTINDMMEKTEIFDDVINKKLRTIEQSIQPKNNDNGATSICDKQVSKQAQINFSKIPPFTESNKLLPPEFIKQLDTYFDCFENITDKSLIYLLRSKMARDVLNWFDMHATEWNTYPEFREAFLHEYWNKEEQYQTFNMFVNAKYNNKKESIIKHFDFWSQIIKTLDEIDLPLDMVIRSFLNHFDPSLRSEMYGQYDNLEEFRARLQLIEKDHQDLKSRNVNRGNFNRNKNYRNQPRQNSTNNNYRRSKNPRSANNLNS